MAISMNGFRVLETGWLETYSRRLQDLFRLRNRNRRQGTHVDPIDEAFVRLHGYCAQGESPSDPADSLIQRVLFEIVEQAPREALELTDRPAEISHTRFGDRGIARMRRTLSAASPLTQEVFLLHRQDGLSYAQIAERLGISVSATEKHIARAMLLLTGEERTK